MTPMNVICSLFLFFPLMGVMFYLAFTWAIRAVTIKEVFFNSFWYPPAWPYRTVFAVALFPPSSGGCEPRAGFLFYGEG